MKYPCRHFLLIFHLEMSKRRNQPGDGEDTARSRVKQRVGLRDDRGQQEVDVDMDTLSIEEPPRTDVQLGSSSSASQVASHVGRFDVADNPASTMVGGQWK